MIFRYHPRQTEFMREPAQRIVMAGVSRASAGPWRTYDIFRASPGRLRSYVDGQLAYWEDEASRCQRRIEVIKDPPEGSTLGIDLHAVRPCGGRLIDGKCEFCDVTTIEEGR